MTTSSPSNWLVADRAMVHIGSPVHLNGHPDSTGVIVGASELGFPRVRLDEGPHAGKTSTFRPIDLVSVSSG